MKRTALNRGQTLVELLVALGVIAIIISMTVGLYVQMFNHYQKVAADVDAQSEARFAMGRATQALRQAGTSPINPPGPPVTYPTPAAGSTPPQATSVTFYDVASFPGDADYLNTTYQQVTITTSATPPPGHLNPDLVVTTYDMNGNQTGSTTIGRDVLHFYVYPVTQSIYDIQIITQPGSGISQGGTIEQPYTLNSRVYISYYQ
jgi:prepilin-type N-terminal cleavage/methylation domain-containing protein